MPNHFHLLLTAPKEPLPKAIQFLMVETTRRLNRRTGRLGHLFQGPHHRSLIQDTLYYRHALKYVLRNPVKAKLCARAEHWPYSSLNYLLGEARPKFAVSPPLLPLDLNMNDVAEETFLDWINRDFQEPRTEKMIRLGLRRRKFDSLVDQTRRKSFDRNLREEITNLSF